MDNNQREQEALNPEAKSEALLEEQLREVVAAEDFFNQASGKLFTKMVTDEITRITRDVTSDKYRKDHVGYNLALSDLLAYRKILRKMQIAGSSKRRAKITERLPDEE